MPNNSVKKIRERRERVLDLMSKGKNQTEIARELNTNRNTVMRDIKELNHWSKKGLYDLAKQTIGTMYYSCLVGHNKVIDRLWGIVDSTDEKVNLWHKLQAYRLILDAGRSKFDLFTHGPSVMEVEGLKDRVDKLKESVKLESERNKPTTYEAAMREKEKQERENNNNPSPSPSPSPSPNSKELERELQLEDYKRATGQLDESKVRKKKVHFVLDPNEISRYDVEKLGIPYEFDGWNKKELKLDVNKISRAELERLGIPYEIIEDKGEEDASVSPL